MTTSTQSPATATRHPDALVPVWWGLGLLVAVEALHEILNIGGPDAIFSLGIQAALQAVAAALCIARCSFEREGRTPWLWIGAGLWSWALGTILWDVLYNANSSPPYPTAADALWLAWYPLTAIGMALLIRERVKAFELHRWMDGLAAMLVVMTPAVALIVQPTADHSADSWQATVVDFSYPILDVILLGAVLGVFGLLAWRPGRTWLLLGLGIAVIALADGVFSVQQARGVLVEGDYNFLWSAGAVLIAAASWAGRPTADLEGDVLGWRSIVLPVAAQLFAAGIQVYGLFFELGKSERLVTLIVLIVVTVQIVLSRPRAAPAGGGRGP
jgi:hypothetical protein